MLRLPLRVRVLHRGLLRGRLLRRGVLRPVRVRAGVLHRQRVRAGGGGQVVLLAVIAKS